MSIKDIVIENEELKEEIVLQQNVTRKVINGFFFLFVCFCVGIGFKLSGAWDFAEYLLYLCIGLTTLLLWRVHVKMKKKLKELEQEKEDGDL